MPNPLLYCPRLEIYSKLVSQLAKVKGLYMVFLHVILDLDPVL